ncbi:MAG: hypothetical protein IPK97_07420 [Ahniella sp.]|nr:hypothetical protein [Ahniella sp.]
MAYVEAFLHAETDEQDATYFVLHQLNVFDVAIADFEAYVARKKKQLDETRLIGANASRFNGRQLALLGHALRHQSAVYTHDSHGRSHGVTIVTARSDLAQLVALGLLVRRRVRNQFTYGPADLLHEKLAGLGNL